MYTPTFRNRRRISLVVTCIALCVVAVIAWIQSGRLANASFFTGSTLLAVIVLLYYWVSDAGFPFCHWAASAVGHKSICTREFFLPAFMRCTCQA